MQQLNLFQESAPVLPITYYPDFLTVEQANELYQHCLQLQWQQNQIRMLGKTMPVPRLECIYGDAGCNYLYSKSVLLKPLPWKELLGELRESITAPGLIQSGGIPTTNLRWDISRRCLRRATPTLPLASVVFASFKSNPSAVHTLTFG